MTQQAFIEALVPHVTKLFAEGSSIFPSIRIAQSALETGWKVPSWNNLGGYKVGNGRPNEFWTGRVVNKGTWEVYDGQRVDIVAAFRAYESIEHFFHDQDLLFELPRYQRVREARSPEAQAEMLYQCGYATDPQYANKLLSIINSHQLKQYDERRQTYMLKKEDADKMIRFLSAGWFTVQGNKEAEKEFNRLANELRKASGQESK
ncbi:glycoside hydrolase family 73 protein [Bacillus horti]|uniref:Flagellar protein FlgJ n=1 Tax=Caldalkalibacillus horti TaxID=77523 RepID=A0ABT9VW06_9BACI|nr:glucosaminidase domain-containing protein [Bacillus horti]MDQ0165181.1 flagellar protein FlgJ [Bacillus horti]